MFTSPKRIATGVPGLDTVLLGGLPANHLYLIDGTPGVGKTTLALQFLLEGVARGEPCLYITLSETRRELEAVAMSHGWTLDGIRVVELAQVEAEPTGRGGNTLFEASEIELFGLSRLLLEEFDRTRPTRMVLDSLSEMRLMAQNALRYRRQVLAFKQHFAQHDCTVVMLDDRSATGQDVQVQSIVHGMIELKLMPLKFGINRRYLSVTKLRGSRFREGHHDFAIRSGGLVVFPRLVSSEHAVRDGNEPFSSGSKALDLLSGNGFDAGTGALLIGPAGSGKSTVASMYAATAAAAGHKALYFAFDENINILVDRAHNLGIPFREQIESGRLRVQQVDPAEIAPGELANQIIHAVEQEGVRVVVLDSLNGYVNAMPQEEFLHLHVHELLSFLNQRGVLTIMILSQHGLIGAMGTPVDVSYLADTVMLLRFFEARGAIRKAISVIKKRSGAHEDTIRELTMSSRGVAVGEPLVAFEGVMTGVPRYLGGEMQVRVGG